MPPLGRFTMISGHLGVIFFGVLGAARILPVVLLTHGVLSDLGRLLYQAESVDRRPVDFLIHNGVKESWPIALGGWVRSLRMIHELERRHNFLIWNGKGLSRSSLAQFSSP